MLIATLRTIFFYLLSIPFTFLWAGVFGLFAYFIPYPARYHIVIGCWARCMHVMAVVILGIRVRVRGRSNIPDRASVIIANHQSAWETFYMQLLFKPQSQVAKASILKIPIFGWTFAIMKPIAIDRSNKRQAMQQVLEKGTQRIKEGNSVLIFAEGTRSLPGKPLKFRKGGAVLAKMADCPIVPVSHNAGELWFNDRFAIRSGIIDVVIHPPMDTAQRSAEDLIAQAESTVLDCLATLSDSNKAAVKTQKTATA